MGPTLPNHSSTHGSSHGSHSACLEDGQETDQLISSNASSRPLSWAVHGQPQQRPEQHPETLRRRTRSCSCSAAQAGPATAAGTAPRAPYAASADGSCGRSPRACRHALVRQKLSSDVRSRCGRSHCRRAGRHDPAATRASAGCMPCRELLAEVDRLCLASWLVPTWLPSSKPPQIPSGQSHGPSGAAEGRLRINPRYMGMSRHLTEQPLRGPTGGLNHR